MHNFPIKNANPTARRAVRGVLAIAGALSLGFFAVTVFAVNPPPSPGVGSGAISAGTTGNVGIGASAAADSRLFVQSASGLTYSGQFQTSAGTPIILLYENGKVGIGGTNTGTSLLYVNGSTTVNGAFTATNIYGTFNGTYGGSVPASQVTPGIFNGGTGSFAFGSSLGVATSSYVGLPQSLSVYGGGYFSGNVGIGTANPAYTLDVNGIIMARSYLYSGSIGSGTGGNTRYVSDDGTLRWVTGVLGMAGAKDFSIYDNANSVSRVTINNTGNVGIGTTAPNGRLQVGNLPSGVYFDNVSDGSSGIGTVERFGDTTGWKWNLGLAKNGSGGSPITGTGNIFVTVQDNGNVGIGTSTPAYKLDVAGTINATNIYQNGSPLSTSQWVTSGSNIYYNAGSVGIGTGSPDNKLSVSVGAAAGGFGQGISILSGNGTFTTGHGGMLQFQNEDVITAGIRGVREGGWPSGLAFYTHNSSAGNTFGSTFLERVRIDNNGNMGIGTASPAQKLEVTGVIQADDQFKTTGGGGDLRMNANFGGTIAGIGLVGANPLMVFTNNTERMRIDSAGNVGIGTTAPVGRLSVASGIGASQMTLGSTTGISQSLTYDNSGWGMYFGLDTGTGSGWIQQGRTNNATPYNLLLQPSGGNVGISTTAPAYPLDVTGNVRFTGTSFANGFQVTSADPYVNVNSNSKYLVLSGGTGWTSTGAAIVIRGASAATNAGGIEIDGSDGAQKGLIVNNMNLTIAGTSALTIGGVTRTTWPSAVNSPYYTEAIYGSGGDIPWRTTATSPSTMRYVYGPFSYGAPACPSGTKQWRLYAEFVDNSTSATINFRIALDGGVNIDFTGIPATWGGSPSYRTYLSTLFADPANTNHANIQTWVTTAGPYVEVRKMELRMFCI